MFATTLTVPTRHARELTSRLCEAGFYVLDTGERLATDEGPDAEAMLYVQHVGAEESMAPVLGVSR